MPTTRSPWPSTRATKQTTLLVPISSAAITPFLVFATMFPRRYAYTSALTIHHAGQSHRSWRRLARAAFLEVELVRQPEIDDAELARQQFVLRIEDGELLEGGDRVLFRQPDFDAVGQDQVPPPLADPHGGAQLAGDRGLVAQQQERLGARRHAAGPHRSAVGVDQRIFRAVLPDGDGAALLQRDVERVGQ